jgi:hypothetical protein
MSSLESLFVIFGIISVGIIAKKSKLLTSYQIEGLEIFLLRISLPCYLFTSIATYDLKKIHHHYLLSYFLSIALITGLVTLLVTTDHKKRFSAMIMKILAAGYVNAALYASPVISLLLNDPTAGILINIFQVIVLQSFFVSLLTLNLHQDKPVLKKISSIIGTPLILMPIIGFSLNYFTIPLHTILKTMIENLGSEASTLALICFGASLAETSFNKKILKKDILILTALKNFAHPLIAFFIGRAFNLEPYWLYSLVIVASAPTPFVVYLIAKQFSIEKSLIKNIIALSSVTSLITLIIAVILIKPTLS